MGIDASARAAVPARERLRRMEFCITALLEKLSAQWLKSAAATGLMVSAEIGSWMVAILA